MTVPTEDVAEQSVEVSEEANRQGMALALALALAGALVMAVAVFFPRANGHIYARVGKNTLIQSGNGWLFIAFAVLIATSVYRIHRNAERYRPAAAVLLVAVIATGLAIYDGTGKRFESKNVIVVVRGSITEKEIAEGGDPGIGVYGTGVGGLLALIGGVWIMGWGFGGNEEGADSRSAQAAQRSASRCAGLQALSASLSMI